ncbi:MAG: ABC transporter substrate-binding protein [Muribaculaceae bacterium]|nr:ABC transporter substrate-binding protein [Muribaculaceae bacterium]
MRNKLWLLFTILLSFLASGCSDDKINEAPDLSKSTIEKTVAVILPMENGLSEHWNRIFTLLSHNIEQAFSDQEKRVKLNIEYHDESSENLEELGSQLADRDDLYAVIGGLYSTSAKTLAATLCRTGVTFMTLATTEELVRGFASTGNLWALTETDITQSEVLLSKVVNYGGKTVGLIANETDDYGKTFVDWFAFQANELGLQVKGLYTYSSSDIVVAADKAAQSGADYVICAPSHIADIEVIVDKFNEMGYKAPRILFSDMGYGSDVIEQLGKKAEGIEGVCFGANPETGFDVSYRTFFGTDPTVGAAQLYDAGMLLAYAAWYQELHPEFSLRDALRKIVDGRDFNMGSWMGEDMRNVVNSLSRGDAPYVRGASGWLDFDSKVYTNVLSTIYYNYKIYDGHYLILDYNTADGGNRTEATLAGWNWKATQMQEFEAGSSIQYDPLTGHQALIVASSTGWSNYRHQADALAMYQLLKDHGYTDDSIILIIADDIATHSNNPEKGVIRIKHGGENVYTDAQIDYCLKDLSPEDFCNILSGKSTAKTPTVVNGDKGTNLLLFWSGHGTPGALCWDELTRGITPEMMRNALSDLHVRKGYRKLAAFVETCYSGSVFEGCTGFSGMIFYTAANPYESSKADVFNTDLGVWMSNRFTSTLIETLTNKSVISMRDLYNRLFINTVGSHVMVYNADNYGNLYNSSMDEFLNP